MSLRPASRPSWTQVKGFRPTTSAYLCPRCYAARAARWYSSQPSSEGSNGPRPYTKDFKTKMSSRARKIFSFVQPTGIPHLGNYLGALRTWRDFQDEKAREDRSKRNHILIYGIADLHSLTSKQSAKERRDHIRSTFASLLAIGLDPQYCTLFAQSQVSAHAELMWILSNVASTGYLSRMTQWKEKMGLENPYSSERSLASLDEKSQEKLKLSLFSYPVLQAADILLYQADTVPVGQDQAQHVEFTRQLARSFNAAFQPTGERQILKPPELLVSPARRVMSLQDPTKKMSKSDPDPLSRILITDTPEEIKYKFKKAKTDSIPGPITYSHVDRPGVSNLIDIYKHVQRNPKNQDTITEELSHLTLGALKSLVADSVIAEFRGIRERYFTLLDQKNSELDRAMLQGGQRANASAGWTMLRVRQAVGLYSPKLRRKETNASADVHEQEEEEEEMGANHDEEGAGKTDYTKQVS